MLRLGMTWHGPVHAGMPSNQKCICQVLHDDKSTQIFFRQACLQCHAWQACRPVAQLSYASLPRSPKAAARSMRSLPLH